MTEQNADVKVGQGGIVFTGPKGVNAYRLKVLAVALRSQTRGFIVNKNAVKVARSLGFLGATAKQLLPQVEAAYEKARAELIVEKF